MQLNQLTRKTPNLGSKRIGRGRGSGKGKTSGRGVKGQNARAGHKKRPDVREKLKKLPKLRGYRVTRIAPRSLVVNVGALNAFFEAGETINPKALAERGLVRGRKGSTPVVKILGDGELSKKLTIAGCAVSQSAKVKIEQAGGTIA